MRPIIKYLAFFNVVWLFAYAGSFIFDPAWGSPLFRYFTAGLLIFIGVINIIVLFIDRQLSRLANELHRTERED